MLINSLEFIAFVFIILIAYKIVPKKIKWVILLIASYIFFILNSKALTIFLVISTLTVYFTALKIGKIEKNAKSKCKEINEKEQKKEIKRLAKRNKKIVLVIGILINIGMLITLKYSSTFIQELNNLFKTNMTVFKFMLPLGISYYTLQAISYIVDVYRGKCEADKNIGKVALFLSFFPQMVEGPIGRYDRLANQLYEPHEITYNNFQSGAELMLWGYFKKMVIADRVAMYVDAVFADYTCYSGPIIALAIVGYTLQIYAEFSGGIDIIRGVSELFGIHLDQNFERPFYSRSIDEFWRRWNITLGTWLKDYVFYPVSLSKFSMKITLASKKIFKESYMSKIIPSACSLLCVWICNGFWHGSGIKYIIYGLYYYVIMMLGKILEPVGKKIIKILKINTEAWSYKLWQILRTGIFVCFGMLIFRADTLRASVDMFKSIPKIHDIEMMFNGKMWSLGGMTSGDWKVLIIATLVFVTVSVLQEHGKKIRETLNKQNIIFKWIVLIALIVSIIVFGIYGEGYNVQSFIYGQF